MTKSSPFDIHAFVQGIRDEVRAEYQDKLQRVLDLLEALVFEVGALTQPSPKGAKRGRGRPAKRAAEPRAKTSPKTYDAAGPGRKPCPSCGKYVGVRSAQCPSCGHEFPKSAKAPRRKKDEKRDEKRSETPAEA